MNEFKRDTAALLYSVVILNAEFNFWIADFWAVFKPWFIFYFTVDKPLHLIVVV